LVLEIGDCDRKRKRRKQKKKGRAGSWEETKKEAAGAMP